MPTDTRQGSHLFRVTAITLRISKECANLVARLLPCWGQVINRHPLQ